MINELKKELIGRLVDIPDLDNVMLHHGYQCHHTIMDDSIVYSNEETMIRIFVKVVIHPDVTIVLNMEYC